MSFKFRLSCLFGFIGFFSCSSGTWADVDVRAYHGVQERIHKDYQHLNPLWGHLALDTGLMHNLRFYGSFTRGMDDRGRSFVKDRPLKDGPDHTWELIKMLFPSPAGALGTDSNANDNLGIALSTTAARAHVIAHLLRFADDVRKGAYGKNADFSSPKVAKDLKEELNRWLNKMKNNKFSNRARNRVLNLMARAISAEGQGKSYPKYFTETVLLSFYVKKSNHQGDIWQLFKSLNKAFAPITIGSDILSHEKLLTAVDLENIAKKLDGGVRLSHEEVFNLLNRDLFYRQGFPYREGQPLIENAAISAFLRKEQREDNGLYFTDCVETSIRHLVNLVLFDADKQGFDLTRLRSGQLNQDVERFYAKQTPSRTNDSSIDVRALWNRVVADLNSPSDPVVIRYVKSFQNELDTGFINLVRVLQKVFAIELEELPRGEKDRIGWLEKALPKVLMAINPGLKYGFTYKVEPKKDDLYGDIEILVESGDIRFSFNLHQSTIHAKVTQLKDLAKRDVQDHLEKSLSPGSDGELTGYQNLLALALAQDRPIQNKQVIDVQPYATFARRLDSNDARIEWLKMVKKGSITPSPASLGNVLSDMSWDDQNTVERISETIVGILSSSDREHPYRQQLYRETKGLRIACSGDTFAADSTGGKSASLSELNNFVGLKYLTLRLSDRVDFKDIESERLSNLETLIINGKSRHDSLVGLKLSKIQSLKSLELSHIHAIKELTIESLPNLERLDLSDNEWLEKVRISDIGARDMRLKSNKIIIDMKLKGLHRAEKVEFEGREILNGFSLRDSEGIKELMIKGIISIDGTEISGLSNLKKITISSITQLANLVVKDNERLMELDVYGVGTIKKLELSSLPSLNTYHFKFCKKLEGLQVSGCDRLAFKKMTKVQEICDAGQYEVHDLNQYEGLDLF